MAENDWQSLSEAHFEKSANILELVESLADESLSLKERRQLRDEYRHATASRIGRSATTSPVTGRRSASLPHAARAHSVPEDSQPRAR